ncbi:hypothetical protein M9H77_18570 [Catharanthus roseus]|uniref:Uncharacterized protein n=1 Tax=Catharanthus roseus TaxID=4058 RepID=A0ACC0B7T1_CATRO|nr:hypothetical protein M9H77_18570 [Catharanthus roseus]
MEARGLGIKSLREMNLALLAKFTCQYEVPEKSLCLARGVEDEGAKMPQFIAMVASSPSVPSRSENDEKKRKQDENIPKMTKTEPSAKIQQSTTQGRLTYHCRLDYLQAFLELKKEE